MKRYFVFANGSVEDASFYKKIISNGDKIICADGGSSIAYRAGIIPEVVIGDMDSAEAEVLNYFAEAGVKLVKLSPEKDLTDTAVAVNYAMQQEADEIIICAGIGSRFDHSLANICLLERILDAGVQGRIVTEKHVIFLIQDFISLEGRIGQEVSLLPFGGSVYGVTTAGLKYPLEDGTFYMNNPYGISNVFTTESPCIKIKQGKLLVIVNNL